MLAVPTKPQLITKLIFTQVNLWYGLQQRADMPASSFREQLVNEP